MLVIAVPARFPLRFLIAVALGALHAAAFIDDATWPIEIAALAGLVALSARAAREADGSRAARAAAAASIAFAGARIGFAFGLGWFLVGVSWIYISLHTYGEMNPLFAGAATVALCAYLSVYPALACAGFAWFRQSGNAGVRAGTTASLVASILAFAGLWTIAELGRCYVFTGFPWLASGYAHMAGPLAGYAPLAGVYGVSMVAASIGAALALAVDRAGTSHRPRGSRWLVMLIVVFGLPLAGSLLVRVDWTVPSGPPIDVRLLQGNVAQDIKFVPGHFEEISEAYLQAVEAKRADLIVLPETAFPMFLEDLPEEIGRRLARDARTLNADIAFGIPIEESEDHYFNSVIAIGRGNERAPGRSNDDAQASHVPDDAFAGLAAQRYDKSHLVPFGEFVPTGFHWFVRLMKMPLGDFTRGSLDQQPMTLAGNRVAFNICYEDLFGEEIIRQAGTANILINVSNVAWFGDSMALPQHLDISRMRSIETGRPMLRSTNTGMTAAIDPHGRVTATLAPFTSGALEVSVQGMTGLTPFIRYGNAVVAALSVAALVLARAIGSGSSSRGRDGRPDVVDEVRPRQVDRRRRS